MNKGVLQWCVLGVNVHTGVVITSSVCVWVCVNSWSGSLLSLLEHLNQRPIRWKQTVNMLISSNTQELQQACCWRDTHVIWVIKVSSVQFDLTLRENTHNHCYFVCSLCAWYHCNIYVGINKCFLTNIFRDYILWWSVFYIEFCSLSTIDQDYLWRYTFQTLLLLLVYPLIRQRHITLNNYYLTNLTFSSVLPISCLALPLLPFSLF